MTNKAMKQSDYQRRFDAAVAEMNNAGVWRWNGTPPYLRIGRKMGFEPRPPYYESFTKVVVLFGTYFAVMWGLAMNLFIWRNQAMPFPLQLIGSAITGLLFGFGMALWYSYVRKKSGLSSWRDL
jgi:hypothetical protein